MEKLQVKSQLNSLKCDFLFLPVPVAQNVHVRLCTNKSQRGGGRKIYLFSKSIIFLCR